MIYTSPFICNNFIITYFFSTFNVFLAEVDFSIVTGFDLKHLTFLLTFPQVFLKQCIFPPNELYIFTYV